MARRTIRVKVKRPVVKVTRSGELYCNNCGRWNRATVGQKNPYCGHCGWRLF